MENFTIKNNAISPNRVVFEDSDYVLHHFKNDSDDIIISKHVPRDFFLELHFCQNGHVTIQNKEITHTISSTKSMLYYDSKMSELDFEIGANSNSYLLQLSLSNLHLLLSSKHNIPEGENIFATQNAILEMKENSNEVMQTIRQLGIENMNEKIKSIYYKGKILELISYLGTDSIVADSGKCPFTSVKKNTIILAKDYLIKDLKVVPKIEDIAKLLHISEKKLKQEFKEMYGLPIYTFFLNHKLNIARDLLAENNLSIQEIGETIGYSNSSHFIAAFKKKFNLTPKKYQAQ
ncbi:hypothetical protein DNU06_02885 [Putridiphycobacter roseus]|uniref:HTH araC/xylS-type domain-containing protein n=1 Tax=Putridiphycobacter roseus TaxID=2219161 RepID=A0A2W1NT22_9FLAO|nr:AraC family transcriptional regulator [Putridiphycobacter roseus]PZE18792.1 hypothetical protein DNU06_02885 [Putridiphycobacter roseus]